MRNEVISGRFTTTTNQDFVVFIIGMRINKWWSIRKWWPVFTAMPPMLKELFMNKDELGFYHSEMTMGFRTIKLVQYWRSTEELNAYAKGDKHLTAWKNFNAKLRNNKAVGIYHETFNVSKGNYESVYNNMPVYGLAGAIGHQAVTPETTTAEKRMAVGKEVM